MGFLGGPEIIVCAVVLVILFGASRVGDLGKGIGTFIREVKGGFTRNEDK